MGRRRSDLSWPACAQFPELLRGKHCTVGVYGELPVSSRRPGVPCGVGDRIRTLAGNHRGKQGSFFIGGPTEYADILNAWRVEGTLDGLDLRSTENAR